MALSPDFMAEVTRTKGDPNRFSELVFGTGLHDGQVRFYHSGIKDVNFLLPGNSWGKTEYIARMAMYYGWHKEGHPDELATFADWLSAKFQILVASYNYGVAKESFERLDLYRKNREEVAALITRQVDSDETTVELANGARIDWGSLDNLGRLVEAARRNRIFVDEAGHIPDLAYTFDSILYPRTMGVGGKTDLLGTPKPHSDPYLLEVFEKGKEENPFYYSQEGSVFENQFWPQSERARVLANPRYVTGWREFDPATDDPLVVTGGLYPILTKMGLQVILGRFILAGGLFFNRLHIARLFSEGLEVEWAGENFFSVPADPKRLYMGGFDLGGNKKRTRKNHGSDPTVGFVIDYTDKPWQIVYYNYIEGGEADWEQKYDVMAGVYKDYRLPYLIIDATGQVDSVQEALQNRGVEVEGIHYGGQGNKKFDMLRSLQLATEMEWDGTRGLLRSPLIERCKHELDHYVLPDEGISQDTVMTLAMVVWHVTQNELPPAAYGDLF